MVPEEFFSASNHLVDTLPLPLISKELVAAKKRGVKVRVVLENSYNNTISQLSIINGVAFEDDATGLGMGGGMNISYSNPKLSNMILRGNEAYDGSAIVFYASEPILNNVTVKNNTDGASALFIDLSPNAILSRVDIIDNSGVGIKFNEVTFGFLQNVLIYRQ